MGKYVKACVGDYVDEGGRKAIRSMEIGQIISPVGKASWRVSFHGIGLTTNVASSALKLVPAADINRYVAAATTTATTATTADRDDGGGVLDSSSSGSSLGSSLGVNDEFMNDVAGSGTSAAVGTANVKVVSFGGRSVAVPVDVGGRSNRSRSAPPRSVASVAADGGTATGTTNSSSSTSVPTVTPPRRRAVSVAHSGGRRAVSAVGSRRVSSVRSRRQAAASAASVGSVGSVTAAAATVGELEEEEEEENGRSGVATIVGNEEQLTGNTYAMRLAAALQHIKSLVGQEVVKQFNGPHRGRITWKVVEDPDGVPRIRDRSNSSVGFNWSSVGYDSNDEFVFARIFLDLLFDDFQISLATMNSRITESGPTSNVFTVEEFLKALSCLIGAACASQKGQKLFSGPASNGFNTVEIGGREYATIEQVPNFRLKLTLTKWKDFVKYFPLIWNNKSTQQSDPWWRIRSLIEEFNRNREQLIQPSNTLVYDESMIGYCPQISSTGNLPHLSFLPDKPTTLGPEFKVMACASTGCNLKLELMEGKLAMASKKYNKEMGTTAALTVRMHESW